MESDEEIDEVQGHTASNLSERRRKQKAIFDRWLMTDVAQQAMEPKTKGARLMEVADEELSMQSLMTRGSEPIKNPREYQLELFERAKSENTIAVLDTGSGKTLIAVLLLRWIIDNELENRAKGNPPRISFFLVTSVTLAYQQASVLENNLDHKITRVCGHDRSDSWHKSKWLTLFSENKVIVCTAAILVECLSKGFINIAQINLLVFDEAHHAKKNHEYARIIKDFYLQTDEASRPRTFGMTASPIDAKSDVFQAASELEAILDSKIATTTDMSLVDAIKRPEQLTMPYAPLGQPVETQMLQAVRAQFGQLQAFQSYYKRAPEIARELGSWSADQYLLSKLSEKRLRLYEVAASRNFHKRPNGRSLHELDKELEDIRSAIAFVTRVHPDYAVSDVDGSGLSSKVIRLREYLRHQFERPTTQRCIVFVDQRDVARMLAMLFQRIGTQHMRSAFLTGSSSNRIDDESLSFRQQVMTLIKFRKGEINCLFATSVAEEGLDVPDCNLVIRFDMPKTMIQFVQSRGRARQQNSKFIFMPETGNSIHLQSMREFLHQERAMRDYCKRLPEDRRLIGNEDSLEALLTKEKGMRVYVEPVTGAKLTYGNALVYLANFVSAIPTDSEEPQHPTYVVSAVSGKFICEALLPGGGPVPIRSAVGRICARKMLAKRSAAFEACLELRKRQYLDEHLMPTYQKKLPAMRNAMLAVSDKDTNQYTMRVKPSIWEQSRGTIPEELVVTIVDFPDGLDRKHQPLALLTRTRMPDFPDFQVYLADGRASRVTFRRLRKTLSVVGIIDKLSAFTLRIFKDVFSKTYEEDIAGLSYWLAPAALTATAASDIEDAGWDTTIDWACLDEVFQHTEYPWTRGTPHEALLDRFIVDPWDGARKFYSISVSETLKPLDAVPNDAVKYRWMENILNYSVNLYKKARERRVWDEFQPVMVAEKILIRRNLLATPETKEKSQPNRAYLCPEPLRISTLPTCVVSSALCWPAIIHRVESYMIALEAFGSLGLEQCDVGIALAALTKDSDNSGDYEAPERINFQKGMGENYERLEFLGDTFLKVATTISTFIQNPNDDEFEYHVKRMLLLCNKNLYEVSKELKLYEYIRSKSFSRRTWYPEGLKLLEGKGVNKEQEVVKQGLADKTIADCSEAIIGAVFLSHDKPGETWREQQWEQAVRAVAKLTTQSRHANQYDMRMHSMTKWDDYRKHYDKPAYQTGPANASQLDLAQKVELEHPYRFKYPRLLRVAFLHPSIPFTHEKLPNYQRLEFLGDALLDMASISHIFYRFPDKDPSYLTEHKMAMVCNKFLGAVCVNIGFHKHLRHASGILESQITSYATELQEARRTAGDGRDYWLTVSDPPKCLPDIVEAYVGAMFIDADFDYGVVQDFFDRHIKWYFEDMTLYDTFANNHPCTHLHHLLQTEYGCEDYRLMAKELANVDGLELDRKDVVAVVMIHNEIIAHSRGKSGRYARLRAANTALEAIKGLAPFEFRARFGCNCHLASAIEGEVAGRGPAADCNV